jgi:hypothetical protein
MGSEAQEREDFAKVRRLARVGFQVLARDDAGYLVRTDIVGSGVVPGHGTTHQIGAADEFSVAGLLGELADDQPPKAHKTSHQNAGGDEMSVEGLSGLLADDQHVLDAEVVEAAKGVKLDDLTAPDDTTDLDASIIKHGLLRKLDDDDTHYLDGKGNLTTPGSTPHAVGGASHTEDTLANFNQKISDGNVDKTTDTRDPKSHAASHENGGGDEISVAGLSGELADNQPPKTHASNHENAGGDEISVAGLSGLLADSQTPLAHKTSHQNGGADEISVAGLSGLLADAQTALAHAASHKNGGGDELLLHELGEPTAAVLFNNQLATNLKGFSITSWVEKTISSGSITADQMLIKVDTESDAGTDDLDEIVHVAGVDLVFVKAESDIRTVVMKHDTTNLWFPGQTDVSLNEVEDTVMLLWNSVDSDWVHPAFGGGGGGGDVYNPLTENLSLGDYCIYLDTSPDSDHQASGWCGYYATDVAVNFGDVLFMKSNSKLGFADADEDTTMPAVVMAISTIAAGNSGWFLELGWARDESWDWTVGGGDANTIHVSLTGTTGNTLIQSVEGFSGGDWVQRVAWAKTSKIIKFNPSMEMVKVS